MVSNTAWGDIYVSGPVSNLLSFFLTSVETPAMMYFLPHIGTYHVVYGSGRPHISTTDRCFIPMNDVTIHPMYDKSPDGNILSGMAFSNCLLECAWDLDAPALLKLSRDFKIRIEATIDEPGMGFRHVVAFDQGATVSDFTEDLEVENGN